MIVLMENTIVLTDAEPMELNQRAANRSGRANDARRARLILLLEGGHTWAAIRDKLDCNDAFIDRSLEQAISGRAARRAVQQARWARGHHADSCAGGAHSGMDAQAYAAGRGDSVEHAQAGNAAQDQSYDGVASVG
jgi:hypothetical protein